MGCHPHHWCGATTNTRAAMKPEKEGKLQTVPTSRVGRMTPAGRRAVVRVVSLPTIPEDPLQNDNDESPGPNAMSGPTPLQYIDITKSKIEWNLAMDLAALVDHERSKFNVLQRSHHGDGNNTDRCVAALIPFSVSPLLEQLASQQASAMARTNTVFHSVSTIAELQLFLASNKVAENVQRGDSVHEMHVEAMHYTQHAVNRSNVLSPHFTELGCAVSIGRDGKLYSCQLFRGP